MSAFKIYDPDSMAQALSRGIKHGDVASVRAAAEALRGYLLHEGRPPGATSVAQALATADGALRWCEDRGMPATVAGVGGER
jgi:hypothetical protein